jgi:hypothetical protein
MVGQDRKGLNVNEFRSFQHAIHILMVECWNITIDQLGVENTFDNYIFFATIIWPQVDPRINYSSCNNYDARILTEYKYEPPKDNPDKPEPTDIERKETFKQNFTSCLNGGNINAYKQKFINYIKNIDLARNILYKTVITKPMGNLYNACIQYLKIKDETGYNPEGTLTAADLIDFFENNLSVFLTFFKPGYMNGTDYKSGTFEIIIIVAIKSKLFVDEIFQQYYVERYVRNLLNIQGFIKKNPTLDENSKKRLIEQALIDIDKSEFPTIADMGEELPGISIKKGGTKPLEKQEDDAHEGLLELKREEMNKQYSISLSNLKIQLRLLFDSFIKTEVSPIIKTLMAFRSTSINNFASQDSRSKAEKEKDKKRDNLEKATKEATTKRDSLSEVMKNLESLKNLINVGEQEYYNNFLKYKRDIIKKADQLNLKSLNAFPPDNPDIEIILKNIQHVNEKMADNANTTLQQLLVPNETNIEKIKLTMPDDDEEEEEERKTNTAKAEKEDELFIGGSQDKQIKKDVCYEIALSAIVGDHDVNPANLVVVKSSSGALRVARIDFGHAFNDLLRFGSIVGGGVKNKENRNKKT